MPKNLTDKELTDLDDRATGLMQDLTSAVEQIKKLRVDKLADPAKAARTFSILARDAANLSVFLLHQHEMQVQRAEIDRLRSEVAKQ